mgnify:CR=1 FL=1
MLLNFNNFLFSGVDTTKNVCYNDGESGKSPFGCPEKICSERKAIVRGHKSQ